MRQTLLAVLVLGLTGAGAVDLLLVDDNTWDYIDGHEYHNYANMDNVEDILTDMGVTFHHEHNNRHRYAGITANPAFLADYRILLWYNDQRVIEQEEYNAVLDWVKDGNCLVVTGYDSLGNPNDPRMAALVGSSTYGDYPFCDRFIVNLSDNFIMDGDWGYFSGAYAILPAGKDHDWALPAPGTKSLATTSTGYVMGPAKLLLTENVGNGGIIIFWNGNWDSIEWWRTTQTMYTVNMFRNMITHLLSYVNVELTSWGGIKDIFSAP